MYIYIYIFIYLYIYITYLYIYVYVHICMSRYVYIYCIEMVAINQLLPISSHFGKKIPPGGVPSTWSTGAQQRRGHGHRVLRGETVVFCSNKNGNFMGKVGI